ncbi:MAG: DNA cytosine methyltransferase [Alphaproteobacteria bacterium]|nr:DNA cytosine methyltransferase [Alphaproteobacteria bacterium]MBP3516234.1 DNA cytosine methyltransferase [Alphaproteobacteria bacterium]
MKNLNENTRMGSALATAFNHRETFLNGNNTAIKQEINPQPIGDIEDFNLPECLKNLSLEEIFESSKLSDDEIEKLKESHANDNLPPMSTDPTQITEFITMVNSSVKAELAILKSAPLSEEEYLIRFQKLQLQAAYQLLAECLIGEDIRQMKAHKGLKDKGKSIGKTTKKDAIAAKYPHLGARRSRDFQKLFIENVWQAIKTAFERGELPTRTLALSHGISQKARGIVGKNHYDFKKWRAKIEDFEVAFKKLNSTEEIKACSLFCNIGVGTSLLEKFTKIKIVVANEKDTRRGKAHRRLYPDCETIIGGIDEPDTFDKIIDANKRHGAKLLLASPPCQEASLLNNSKNKGKTHKAALFEDTLKVVRAVGYDYIFIENVPQWLASRPEAALSILGEKTIGEYVVDELEKLGYNVTVGILSAADYETAEDRERAIILACKKELGIWKFPKKHKFRPTVFETIGNFSSFEAGEIDPKNKWNYGLPLVAHEIDFLAHTPTGCSAWDNLIKFQPKNKDGSNARAQF